MGSKLARIKYRIYEILEKGKPDDKASIIFDWFIIILVGLNVFALIIETTQNLSTGAQNFLGLFDFVSVMIFSVEYLLRVWTITCNPTYSHPIKGRLAYAMSFMALVDFGAILPFYLHFALSKTAIDLRFIRILRMLRIFRILKLGRYSNSIKMLGLVLKRKASDLIIAVSIVVVLLVLAASILFYVESGAGVELTGDPNHFASIPEALWWAICTLTTIGYGDMVPVTVLGRILTSLIAILSIGLVALPAAMLVSGYQEVMEQFKKQKIVRRPSKGQYSTSGKIKRKW
ncbi:MAG TPA: ion transporter [Caldisericia bacterium]|nr:ion transporter [Caldisericia bacterium]HPF49394.1 ion transporter [Caldisericia bacterium]HPI84403.1 ion transporter [Caldisericia bacterium]HPQ93565.1 ion transporter [Caldisericia bacterium]HRV75534.1 ion transporter [Caldisericia bacterium]